MHCHRNSQQPAAAPLRGMWRRCRRSLREAGLADWRDWCSWAGPSNRHSNIRREPYVRPHTRNGTMVTDAGSSLRQSPSAAQAARENGVPQVRRRGNSRNIDLMRTNQLCRFAIATTLPLPATVPTLDLRGVELALQSTISLMVRSVNGKFSRTRLRRSRISFFSATSGLPMR